MLSYTIALGDRSADRPALSDLEAGEMAQLGFRFSEFRPESGRYRLSPGYRTLQNLDRGTLTYQQSETEARRAAPPVAPTDAAAFEPAPAVASAGAAPAGVAPAPAVAR